MKQTTLKIQGIECPNCVLRLEGLEDQLPGLEWAEASYHKAQMMVKYDETRLSLDQLEAAIERLGYRVVGRE